MPSEIAEHDASVQVGDMVHFVDAGSPCVPAVVTYIYDEPDGKDAGAVNLSIIPVFSGPLVRAGLIKYGFATDGWHFKGQCRDRNRG